MATQKMTVWFDLVGNDMKPRSVDGRELANWQAGPNMETYMRQLLRDGWQVVRQSSPGTIVFERQLP